MRILSSRMRVGEDEEDQESFFPDSKADQMINKWVRWFRRELRDARKVGDDVEILIGRKPNNHKYVV